MGERETQMGVLWMKALYKPINSPLTVDMTLSMVFPPWGHRNDAVTGLGDHFDIIHLHRWFMQINIFDDSFGNIQELTSIVCQFQFQI